MRMHMSGSIIIDIFMIHTALAGVEAMSSFTSASFPSAAATFSVIAWSPEIMRVKETTP